MNEVKTLKIHCLQCKKDIHAFPRNAEKRKFCNCTCYFEYKRNNKEIYKITNKTHGKSHDKLYQTWLHMKTRCKNSKYDGFKHYGGRGITLCKEWDDDYMTFHEWAMQNGYTEGLTIDRIDVDEGYNGLNCRFSTWEEQANNKRNNIKIEYDGEVKTLAEWSKIKKIPVSTIYNRVNRQKWSVERIFDENKRVKHAFKSDKKTIPQWSKHTGINLATLNARLRRGWTLSEALTIPVDTRRGRKLA